MPAKKSSAASTLYSVHPSVAYLQSVIRNLPEKTGRSLDEWITLLRKEGLAGETDRREWLKKKFKLGGTTAWVISEQAEGKATECQDASAYLEAAAKYVEAMYRGAKAGLRPIHDALVELARSLGPDVRVCPCQTIVPLYRQHVFAEIKPATRTRIDFGLALKAAKAKLSKRLIDTGGLAKGDRITHRIPITARDEIDAEVNKWLKIAYELDG